MVSIYKALTITRITNRHYQSIDNHIPVAYVRDSNKHRIHPPLPALLPAAGPPPRLRTSLEPDALNTTRVQCAQRVGESSVTPIQNAEDNAQRAAKRWWMNS